MATIETQKRKERKLRQREREYQATHPKWSLRPDQRLVRNLVFEGGTHDTVFLLHACSRKGERWIGQYIPDDATRWAGRIVVEHRFVGPIVGGVVRDGLRVARV